MSSQPHNDDPAAAGQAHLNVAADQTLQEFEKLVADLAQPNYLFRLYVSGTSPRSALAIKLVWTPTDAAMGPSGDMGYTWGHFEGRSKDANGNPVVTTGRYMTIWRKQPDGNWKVVLDAGANEPLNAGDCCKLPAGD